MRFATALAGMLVLVLSLGAAPGSVATPTGGASVVAAQQQPGTPATPKAQVDINVNRNGGHGWWASPTWIAIGVLALVLLIVIVALIARGGGGPTVIRG